MVGSRGGDRGRGGSCAIWGVVNVTPDSFSDGGEHLKAADAVRHGFELVRQGAHVIDVGGESTRPKGPAYGEGYGDVHLEEEIARTTPVVDALVRAGVRVSIDTTKAGVARAALDAGASIVNDVSCGASGELLDVCASFGAELCLMHNRARGEVGGTTSSYDDVVKEVCDELAESVQRAERAGVKREHVWLDPGIGFSKGADDSAELLANLGPLVESGHRVLVGPSRKSFIAALTTDEGEPAPPPKERLGGTASAITLAVMQGVAGVRVHDVSMMRQAVRLTLALQAARRSP